MLPPRPQTILTSAALLDLLGGDEGALDGVDGLPVDGDVGNAAWSQKIIIVANCYNLLGTGQKVTFAPLLILFYPII